MKKPRTELPWNYFGKSPAGKLFTVVNGGVTICRFYHEDDALFVHEAVNSNAALMECAEALRNAANWMHILLTRYMQYGDVTQGILEQDLEDVKNALAKLDACAPTGAAAEEKEGV